MLNIRIIDVVKAYDGKSDIETWTTRFELVVNFQGETENERLQLSMLLNGFVLSIYTDMNEVNKKDPTSVKNMMRTPFRQYPFT
ncbi:hypothetical protein GJ496_002190 [Pomphorhynchus laevis]|nr:hypothetical protein GJ496_002190 [Pomphorhynchus laevis]